MKGVKSNEKAVKEYCDYNMVMMHWWYLAMVVGEWQLQQPEQSVLSSDGAMMVH